jgi:hypothetical protein
MSDDRACCILCICCDCDSDKQRDALAAMIRKHRPTLTDLQAVEAAARVLDAHGHFVDVKALIDDARP